MRLNILFIFITIFTTVFAYPKKNSRNKVHHRSHHQNLKKVELRRHKRQLSMLFQKGMQIDRTRLQMTLTDMRILEQAARYRKRMALCKKNGCRKNLHKKRTTKQRRKKS